MGKKFSESAIRLALITNMMTFSNESKQLKQVEYLTKIKLIDQAGMIATEFIITCPIIGILLYSTLGIHSYIGSKIDNFITIRNRSFSMASQVDRHQPAFQDEGEATYTSRYLSLFSERWPSIRSKKITGSPQGSLSSSHINYEELVIKISENTLAGLDAVQGLKTSTVSDFFPLVNDTYHTLETTALYQPTDAESFLNKSSLLLSIISTGNLTSSHSLRSSNVIYRETEHGHRPWHYQTASLVGLGLGLFLEQPRQWTLGADTYSSPSFTNHCLYSLVSDETCQNSFSTKLHTFKSTFIISKIKSSNMRSIPPVPLFDANFGHTVLTFLEETIPSYFSHTGSLSETWTDQIGILENLNFSDENQTPIHLNSILIDLGRGI